ncbi:hypothetical protein NEMBOFW57_002715 [Staphylotrichum longicolle]|uniref:Uncharacterized protein n=1 Tax=Staphylotrichum longicolle TaxID=669026 RepID=A0AAD4F3E6_9PEZI|nr:hypothetical protein NEMBOFW57_002715 [Staphylotrichum longicolle]
MSSDNGNNGANDMARQRRGSITSSAFAGLFRNNSISQPSAAPFPTPLASTAVNDPRRRLSVTTLGLSGTSPTTPSALLRRGSLSTNSDSIDENAVDDEEGGRAPPVTPFTRRMSFGATQAMRGARGAVLAPTSVSDMPAPPAQAPKPRAPQKPDHFQERILKGDFYMD